MIKFMSFKKILALFLSAALVVLLIPKVCIAFADTNTNIDTNEEVAGNPLIPGDDSVNNNDDSNSGNIPVSDTSTDDTDFADYCDTLNGAYSVVPDEPNTEELQTPEPEVDDVENNDSVSSGENKTNLKSFGAKDWHSIIYNEDEWNFTLSKLGEEPIYGTDFRISGSRLIIMSSGLKLSNACTYEGEADFSQIVIDCKADSEITMDGVSAPNTIISITYSYNYRINFVEGTTSSFLSIDAECFDVDLVGPGKLIIDNSSGIAHGLFCMLVNDFNLINGINVDIKFKNAYDNCYISANSMSILDKSSLQIVYIDEGLYTAAISLSKVPNISEDSEFYACCNVDALVINPPSEIADLDFSGYYGSNDMIPYSNKSQINDTIYPDQQPDSLFHGYHIFFYTDPMFTNKAKTIYKPVKGEPLPVPDQEPDSDNVDESNASQDHTEMINSATPSTGDINLLISCACLAVFLLAAFLSIRQFCNLRLIKLNKNK